MEDLNAKEGNERIGELVCKYGQEPVRNAKKMGSMMQTTRRNIKQTLVLRARKSCGYVKDNGETENQRDKVNINK